MVSRVFVMYRECEIMLIRTLCHNQLLTKTYSICTSSIIVMLNNINRWDSGIFFSRNKSDGKCSRNSWAFSDHALVDLLFIYAKRVCSTSSTKVQNKSGPVGSKLKEKTWKMMCATWSHWSGNEPHVRLKLQIKAFFLTIEWLLSAPQPQNAVNIQQVRQQI